MTKNVKHLITAGCSFSQVPNLDVTWPVPLGETIGCETVYTGHGASGNGIVSRKVIYNTMQALKKYKPEEILVGIMWSGYERREYYSEQPVDATILNHGRGPSSNPLHIIEDANYYILNKHWKDPLTTTFMANFNNLHDALMISLEHILRTQWFLKLNNIPYFMTTFDYDALDAYPYTNSHILNNKDLKFLWDQIDKEPWLPIENCYQWVKYESGKDFARPPDPHPSTEQHQELVKRVILPFLLEKNMIYDIIV